MIRFESDYSEGAHPQILEKLIITNMEQTPGYGEDYFCDNAKSLIIKQLGQNSCDVHFLMGGTQTNLTLISTALRPHQGVITTDSGHINTHEAGAIEATGHKVLSIVSQDGKLTASDIKMLHDSHWQDPTHEHIVQPALVYISQPTECGTVYSLHELNQLSSACRDLKLLLYIDGARLGYALAAQNNSPSLQDYASLCDAFYIGGTKIGALFGEALIIINDDLKRDFRYIVKQRGGLLAKGRLLGIQFETLFENGLYYSIAKHAVSQGMRIREAFTSAGYELHYDSFTNQQFPILPDNVIRKLEKNYAFHKWQRINNHQTVVRFCTSWATPAENVDMLINSIKYL